MFDALLVSTGIVALADRRQDQLLGSCCWPCASAARGRSSPVSRRHLFNHAALAGGSGAARRAVADAGRAALDRRQALLIAIAVVDAGSPTPLDEDTAAPRARHNRRHRRRSSLAEIGDDGYAGRDGPARGGSTTRCGGWSRAPRGRHAAAASVPAVVHALAASSAARFCCSGRAHRRRLRVPYLGPMAAIRRTAALKATPGRWAYPLPAAIGIRPHVRPALWPHDVRRRRWRVLITLMLNSGTGGEFLVAQPQGLAVAVDAGVALANVLTGGGSGRPWSACSAGPRDRDVAGAVGVGTRAVVIAG